MGHAGLPVRLLYYHAIELYLKALLRQRYCVQKLENKFRHNIKRMSKRAEALGLSITEEDRQVLDLMASQGVLIEVRYIRAGHKTWPTPEALNRCCISLRLNVGTLLRQNGVMVRV